MKKEYTLNDTVIMNIAQLVQLAIVTGQDVTDHFRMIKLSPSDLDATKLDLSESFVKEHEERMNKLLKTAQELSDAAQKKQAGFIQ